MCVHVFVCLQTYELACTLSTSLTFASRSRCAEEDTGGRLLPQHNDKEDLQGAQARGKKPLFVQLLENLWAVYDAVLVNRWDLS